MVLRDLLMLAYRETWAMCMQSLQGMLAQSVAARVAKLPKVSGGVAIIPMHGMISQRGSIWQEVFGGTSTEGLAAAYTRAINEPAIKAVVLDADTPGGTVSGVKDAADAIHQGSVIKPTYAIANGQAASAGYWLASQVGKGRFMAAANGDVGSIGVYRAHFDESVMMEQIGVKATFISIPDYKTEANPFAPLSDDAAAHHMQQVMSTYEDFVADVARGRGVQAKVVKADYGKGRSYNSAIAAQMGMVDGVKSLAQMLREMGGEPMMMGHRADEELTESLCMAWLTGMPEQMHTPPSREIRAKRLELAQKA